ncbi:MAG TPA: TorD/DmsD family molecular chaperone [Candidatus Wunengus sp. YC60]|uniref:TorD/DmsD family molecular chaperone n=1 Tax=Candidatus Wunengus sp. YC60 TaxID=3367697 RepID=UPI004027FA9E
MGVESAGFSDQQVASTAANLLTRSVMYQILSACFLYPEEKNLSILKSSDFQEHTKDLMLCYADIDDGAAVQSCLNEVRELYGNANPEDLQKIYSRIVGHTMSKECPLYETQFGAAHVYQQVHELGDIQGFYKAFGLDLSEIEKERCDHISVELEFMHFLLYKQAYALENHGDEKAQICLEAQKKFLKEHIGKWMPLFAVLFGRKAGEGFYCALSALTKEFLRLEMKLLDIKTELYKESDLNQEAVAGVSDECLSCASSEDFNEE